jgi:peptidyl-prolyl cis-trans isomerase B (cyclophilin B)
LVAMAKTEVEPPGSSGSQFFVVTAPADAGLPPDYAVLGKVTDGMDTVDAIAALGDPSDPAGTPTQTVTIDKVTIAPG